MRNLINCLLTKYFTWRTLTVADYSELQTGISRRRRSTGVEHCNDSRQTSETDLHTERMTLCILLLTDLMTTLLYACNVQSLHRT